jgi:acyl carrier protein
MNRNEIFEKVQNIFRNNFDDDSLIISDTTTANDVEGWDSFEQINLLVTMEEEFGVKFNVEQVAKLKNVGDMVDYFLSKLIIIKEGYR